MSPFLGRLTIDRSRVCQDSVAQGGGGDTITRTGHHAGVLIAIRLGHTPARGVLGLALGIAVKTDPGGTGRQGHQDQVADGGQDEDDRADPVGGGQPFRRTIVLIEEKAKAGDGDGDEKPPATQVLVMQTPHGDRQGRQEDADRGEEEKPVPNLAGNQGEEEEDGEVDQERPPVLAARSPAGEDHVLQPEALDRFDKRNPVPRLVVRRPRTLRLLGGGLRRLLDRLLLEFRGFLELLELLGLLVPSRLALRLGLGLALTWRRLIAIAIRGVLLWWVLLWD